MSCTHRWYFDIHRGVRVQSCIKCGSGDQVCIRDGYYVIYHVDPEDQAKELAGPNKKLVSEVETCPHCCGY